MENKNKTVVLVGRPNVGKSTLFNRLIGRRRAIETDVPGTTRDRLYGEVTWQDKTFDLVDLAGVEFGSKKEIDQNIQAGVNLAIDQADLIVFVVDWAETSNEHDRRIARTLRKHQDKVILAVNKCDNITRFDVADSFKRLGGFPIVPISAISGKNTGDLLELIVKHLGELPLSKKAEKLDTIKLSVIGRPNVGKSTLINSIIGEKRLVVSSEAGTTRDTVSVKFFHKGGQIELIDTAGVRRRGKIEKDTIESFSLLRTHDAMKESDVVVVVIDAVEGLVASDTHILGQAKEWGKGIVLAINKIDLWGDKTEENMNNFLFYLQDKLNFVPWLPTVFISAQDDENIKPLLNQVILANKSRETIIPEEELAQILQDAKDSNNQLISLISIRQSKNKPPIFKVVYKGAKPPHYTQIRYLENRIRDIYPMNGSPVFIDLESRKNRTS